MVELDKKSDLTAQKIKMKEEEVLPILNKYLERIEKMVKLNVPYKLIVPLGKNNIELLNKLAREKLGIELEYIPVTSAERQFTVTIKKKIK
ncbi:MAG: hypothetical protein RXR31_03025 [Thermoproteota archaeon]|jgi:hypothetical protein